MPECETCGRAPHPGMSCFAAEPKYPDDFPFPMADVWRDYYSFRFGDGKRHTQTPGAKPSMLAPTKPEPPITLVIQSPVKPAPPLQKIKTEGTRRPWQPSDGLAARPKDLADEV